MWTIMRKMQDSICMIWNTHLTIWIVRVVTESKIRYNFMTHSDIVMAAWSWDYYISLEANPRKAIIWHNGGLLSIKYGWDIAIAQKCCISVYSRKCVCKVLSRAASGVTWRRINQSICLIMVLRPENNVNIMDDDALAPCIARAPVVIEFRHIE